MKNCKIRKMNVILHELYSGGMQFLLVLEHNFCSET